MEHSILIQNRTEEMNRISAFIEEVIADYKIEPTVAFMVSLAVDEAIANCVMYAYEDKEEGPIGLTTSLSDDTILISVTDNGREFDPTKVPDADTSLSAEDRQIGGLGIYIIRQSMDSMAYRRENGQNILTLTKKIR